MSLRRMLAVRSSPLCLAALAIAGCKVNSINYFPPHPAQVRVLNLMPDCAGVDVQINGAPAFTNVAFQTATGYQNYDNQTTPFTVTFTGSTTTLSDLLVSARRRAAVHAPRVRHRRPRRRSRWSPRSRARPSTATSSCRVFNAAQNDAERRHLRHRAGRGHRDGQPELLRRRVQRHELQPRVPAGHLPDPGDHTAAPRP